MRHEGSRRILILSALSLLCYHLSRRITQHRLRRKAEARLIELTLAGAVTRVQSATNLTSLAATPLDGTQDGVRRVKSLASLELQHDARYLRDPEPSRPPASGDIRRTPSHQALLDLCDSHRICGPCLSRCATHEDLTKLDEAAMTGDGSGAPCMHLSEANAKMRPPAELVLASSTCTTCEVCCDVQRSWLELVRTALKWSLSGALAYLLWLRFVASRETARKHLFTIVRTLGERLFSYRVEGAERIPKGACVLCVYHGFVPLDMYFLHEWIARHLGRLPTTLVADFVFRIPLFSYFVRLCGGVPAGRAAALEALRNDGLVIVAPGGVREAMTTSADDYLLRWYGKSGFAEVALQTSAPIVPLFTKHIREVFLVLGGANRLVQRLYRLTRFPFTPFIGPLPQRLTSFIGECILPDTDRHASAQSLSADVQTALEALMRAKNPAPA